MGAKIRNVQLQKIPYMLVVGAREASQRQVSVRFRASGDEGALDLDAFVKRISSEIRSRQ